ncbi:MAG: hypothetical protein LBQ88_16890 [Treponema sp.]|nr:hypothetical protein [Treponema sp.]
MIEFDDEWCTLALKEADELEQKRSEAISDRFSVILGCMTIGGAATGFIGMALQGLAVALTGVAILIGVMLLRLIFQKWFDPD